MIGHPVIKSKQPQPSESEGEGIATKHADDDPRGDSSRPRIDGAWKISSIVYKLSIEHKTFFSIG